MRRPDLPLIAIVLAAGAALALFAADEPSAPPDASVAGANDGDLADDLIADAGEALRSCLAGDVTPAVANADVPEDPAALVRQVSRRVEKLRELDYSHPVEARFLAPAAMSRRLDVLSRRELPEGPVKREGEVLELLGALPAGSDLGEVEREALSSQVIGLYDPETTELLVERSGSAGPEEQMTLAHELEHALADQRLDLSLPKGYATADRVLAKVAVVEGDATLTMTRYALAELGLVQLSALGQGSLPAQREFDALPYYIQRSLLFPYLEGLRLVCYRWLKGGWDAVDDLYARPPASSDQVMFPVRYGEGEPADPPETGSPGRGWKPLVRRDLGAAELEWLLGAPGGDPEEALPKPRALAAAWAGGDVTLWGRGDERALAVALVQRDGVRTLCGAMSAWGEVGPPGDSETAVDCDGPRVRMGIAPSAAEARRIATGG
jgi:hypothetical protein